MRVGRVRVDGAVHLGRVDADGQVCLLRPEGTEPFADVLREVLASGTELDQLSGPRVRRPECEFLSPVRFPSAFLGVGLNYREHAAESRMESPKAPLIFSKSASCITDPEADIVLPATGLREVDYEAELALVMGRRCRDVDEQEAERAIFGYTLCNDVSARDAQFSDGQWFRGKSCDTFGPLGPWVVTGLGASPDLAIRCLLNQHVMQDDRTSRMIYTPAQIVSYVSRFMTLQPGDVIATGTPEGVGFARQPPVYLRHGDEVVVEVEGVGRLRNRVAARTSRAGPPA